MTTLLVFAGVMVATALGTGFFRNYALRHSLLDRPNARSSHQGDVPRGGGAAIALVLLAAAALLAAAGQLSPAESLAWLGGGALVAVTGFLDDRRGLAVGPRLLAQSIAACTAVYAARGFPPVPWPGGAIELGAAGWLAGLFVVLWSVNLFNFMDGIDGLAGSQSLFVAGSAALLGVGGNGGETWLLYCIAAASAGFLLWNWPPARIFMGDVGSGFLGFALALALLLGARAGHLTVWTWFILHGLFVVDASVTLVTRLLRREPIHTAHHSHAYQRLSRHWRSHARVTLAFAAINIGWLLPLAACSVRWPDRGAWLALVGVAPLLALAIALHAGRPGEIGKRRDMETL